MTVAEYDPRIIPARPDLAARHLEGKVTAARFVAGELREVVAAQAPLRRAPANDAPLDTEALRGERVVIYESTDEGWSWGQLESDGYVGWLPSASLEPPGSAPTHRVSALRTFVFPGPSIKLPPVAALSFGSVLNIIRFAGEQDAFAVTAASEHIPARHVATIDTREPDFVTVAERFVGVPYLWGGKTSLGVDCSGLVQLALASSGIACPRDSDMQEAALGIDVDPSMDISSWQRGDLVFWPGHVAIARGGGSLVHANAYHMAVAIEPAEEAVRRVAASGTRISSIRRLSRPQS
jgi:cell wall-associated NlpC family hydrolase